MFHIKHDNVGCFVLLVFTIKVFLLTVFYNIYNQNRILFAINRECRSLSAER